MNRLEIEEGLKKLAAEKEEVVLALQRAEREHTQAQTKIKELDEALPDLLASIALREGSSSKLMREVVINGRARDKEQRVIDRYPFLKEGLDRKAKKLNSPNRGPKLIRNKDRWNEYDKVKAEISAHPYDRNHSSRESKLLGLAFHPDLNATEDAGAFLKELG